MGVWIETAQKCVNYHHVIVTPFVGVWIETDCATSIMLRSEVTPFVGVWIETYFTRTAPLESAGHTLRGCVD